MYKSLASNLTRNLYSHQYPQTYFALFAFLKQQIVIYLKPWAHLSSRIGEGSSLLFPNPQLLCQNCHGAPLTRISTLTKQPHQNQ